MNDSTKKSNVEQKQREQEKLEPCVTPPSPEAKRTDRAEDACDDGVK